MKENCVAIAKQYYLYGKLYFFEDVTSRIDEKAFILNIL